MTGPNPAGRDRIFISYRNDELGIGVADRLYKQLDDHFSKDQIFYAPRGIGLAQNFVIAINDALRSCRVLLVLIGDRWLTIADEHGRIRLSDPEDYVRMEIETALAQPNVEVIPILVDGARMPPAGELPSRMAGLVQLNSLNLSLSPFNFNADVDRLIKRVNEFMPRKVLAAGPIVLSIPLFVLAWHFASSQGAQSPRWSWVVLVSAVLGAVVAAVDFRRSTIWLVAIEAAFLWCIAFTIYSLGIWHIKLLLPWNGGHWSASPGARFLAILAGTEALINVSILLILAQRFRKQKRVVHALLFVFLGCTAVGLGIKSFGYVLHKNNFHPSGWIFFVALVANLFAPIIALKRKLYGSRDSPSAVRVPPPGGDTAAHPTRANRKQGGL